MKMKILILSILFAGITITINLHGQTISPGSIEASWENAPRHKPVDPPVVKKTKPVPKAPAIYPVWDARRAFESQPWPYVPKSATAAQYYAANTMIIDSLQSLYCLSTNYIRSLQARNEGAYRAIQPERKKEFQYTPEQTKPMRHESIVRESLAGIYKELQELLHNCIYGR